MEIVQISKLCHFRWGDGKRFVIAYYLNSKNRTYSSVNIVFMLGTQLCKDKFLGHCSETTLLFLYKHLFKNNIAGLRHCVMMSVSIEPNSQNLGSGVKF